MAASVCSIDSKCSDQISALLKSPSPHEVQGYFQELIAKRQCNGLTVNPEGKHGKGVYADIDYKEGDLILRDQMLVGAQHSSNKIDCLVCSFCFQFIGSIELQIGRKLYLQELGISEDNDCGPSDRTECSAGISNNRSPLPQDTIESLMNCSMRLPFSEKFPLPSVVSCPGGCKEAYYCSESCAKNDWDSFHSLLCTGKGSKSSNIEALKKFIQHANETNDIFILAAKVISFTILRYRKLKVAQFEKLEKQDAVHLNFRLLLEAWKPVSMGYKRRWWDCIALPDDVDSCDEAAFRMQIRDLAFTSVELLKEAMYDKECEPLFSLEIYGHIIGMFELNNLDLVVASPVEDYFLYIDDLALSQKKEAEKITKHVLDALGDDYSICCQGSAFFPLQSCMNHSCIPNARAFKREEDRDGQATIVALRQISAREEITVSYIDEDLSYEERQTLLEDYGFRCQCPRCMEEGS